MIVITLMVYRPNIKPWIGEKANFSHDFTKTVRRPEKYKKS